MNVALRLFAGVIDLLQFIFFITLLAFQFITPVGGAAVGGVTGAVLCWNASSGIFEGIKNAALCATGGGLAGSALSAIAGPVGVAIDIAISCTFGVLLILALWVTGRFSLMAVVIGFSSETLPVVNGFVPGWSILVHRCIQVHKQTNAGSSAPRRSKLMFALDAASLIPGVGTALKAARPLVSAASATTQATTTSAPTPTRIPLQTQSFDGIRPANDNHPHSYVRAA